MSSETRATCRFRPGQEEEARAFLDQPSAFERVKMIPNQRFRFGLILAAVGPAFVWFVLPREPDPLVDLILGLVGLVFFLSIVLLAALVARQQGWFILDPERAILRYRKKDHPFDTLGLPRLGKAKVLERSGEHSVLGSEITYDVLILGETTVGTRRFRKILFEEDAMPKKKLVKIANILNGMLQEYHEKEAVRRWLEQRESRGGQHER